MHRRHWGFALFLVVVLGMTVVGGVRQRRLPGIPVASPTAAPPAVGDCLIRDRATAATVDVRGVDGFSGSVIGPCTAAHFGEITAGLADGSSFPRSVVNRLSTPDPGYCDEAAQAYFGLVQQVSTGTPGQTNVGFALWYPTQQGRSRLVGPSPRQQQLGQRWIACALYTAAGTYLGSARKAFAGGVLPSPYTWCSNQAGTDRRIPCAGPHRTELFGSAAVTGAQIDQPTLTATCVSMVKKLTGRPDPTGTGRLDVVATIYHSDDAGVRRVGPPTGTSSARASAICVVAVSGEQNLQQSLSGWGARALPLG